MSSTGPSSSTAIVSSSSEPCVPSGEAKRAGGGEAGPPFGNTYEKSYDSFGVLRMTTISASEARARLYGLLDEAAESGEAIQITGRRNNAVLISERDWRAIQETLYLLSIPGMRSSIRRGMKTPANRCSTEPGW